MDNDFLKKENQDKSDYLQEQLIYLTEKKAEVLSKITPILHSFGVYDFDYTFKIETGIEKLRIEGTYIGCSFNSISAIVDEVIGWIFVNIYLKHRSLGKPESQVVKVIKRYWNEF